MTGQGSAVCEREAYRLEFVLRSLNHRSLDLRLRLDPALATFGAYLEATLRKAMVRGRIELVARFLQKQTPSIRLDHARAKRALSEIRTLRDELAPQSEIPLSLLASVPDLFVSEHNVEEGQRLKQDVMTCLHEACEAVHAMRTHEGTSISEDLRQRISALEGYRQALVKRATSTVPEQREALRRRLHALLEDEKLSVDEQRLAQEVAILADRCDVSEELTRLRGHCEHFETILASEESSIGRKLDFLLQEMSREANTLGAKSADIQSAHLVVDIKAEISRMREQVQNMV